MSKDHLFPADETPPTHEGRCRPPAKKYQPRGRAPGEADRSRLRDADPVIYGLARPMSGECLLHTGLDEPALEEWKRKNLSLKAHYTAFDFTPAGRVSLLRLRGYDDAWIAEKYPELREALDGPAAQVTTVPPLAEESPDGRVTDRAAGETEPGRAAAPDRQGP